MPEREYFSLRYAVPGYSFLLVVIAVNIWPLILVLKEMQADVFGAFLGFLSLFAGSAIGFLVSQLFYFKFNRNETPFRIRELKTLADLLIESAKPKESLREKLKGSKDDIEAISDFLFNISAKENEAFLRYSERRWDTYLLMSSSLWSLGAGILSGIAVRVYFQIVLFKNPPAIDRLNLTELWTWIFALVSILGLMFILWNLRHRIMEAYRPFVEGFVRYVAQNDCYKDALAQAFPEYFPPKERQADKTAAEREKRIEKGKATSSSGTI